MPDSASFKVLLLGDVIVERSCNQLEARVVQERSLEQCTSALLPFVKACDVSVAMVETQMATDADRSHSDGKDCIECRGTGSNQRDELPTGLRADAVNLAGGCNMDQREGAPFSSSVAWEILGAEESATGADPQDAGTPLIIEVPEEFGGGKVIVQDPLAMHKCREADENYGAQIKTGDSQFCAGSVSAPYGDADSLHVAFPSWNRDREGGASTQRRVAQQLSESGFDLVIGAGSRDVQEIRRENGCWVVYGLSGESCQAERGTNEVGIGDGASPLGFWGF